MYGRRVYEIDDRDQTALRAIPICAPLRKRRKDSARLLHVTGYHLSPETVLSPKSRLTTWRALHGARHVTGCHLSQETRG